MLVLSKKYFKKTIMKKKKYIFYSRVLEFLMKMVWLRPKAFLTLQHLLPFFFLPVRTPFFKLFNQAKQKLSSSMLDGRAPVIRVCLSLSAVLSSIFSLYVCHSHGVLFVQWTVKNSRGTRKLARTPHVNKKKKKAVEQYPSL